MHSFALTILFGGLGGGPVEAAPPHTTEAVVSEPEVAMEPAEGGPADPPATEASDYTLEAFVDTSYALNFNFPDNHVYRGTATTPRSNEFTIPAAGLLISKQVSEAAPWWFEFGVHFGSGINALSSSELVVPDAEALFVGPAAFRHLARANAGLSFDSGTSVGAGLFSSPIGIGGYWSKDNWNYTPSWESNAAAFYLAGLRVSQALPAGFSVDGWIVNGWQTLADANRAPSYLVALNWSPDARWFLSQQVYAGPEGTSIEPSAWRVHTDSQLTYQTDDFGVGIVWDFGRDGPDTIGGSPQAMWTGGALFGRWRLLDRPKQQMYTAVRPGVWWDPDGRIFGVDQALASITATLDAWFYGAILARIEYRFDHSTADGGFFYRANADQPESPGLANQQHTLFFVLTAQLRHRFDKRGG